MRITVGIIGLLVSVCMPSWALGDISKLDTQTPLRAVYFVADSNTEQVTVALIVLAGEVDVDGPEGLSHYLEHLMFWHADNVDGEPIHARDGNAWVNGIVTTYYNRAESTELADMLEFASRIMTTPELDRNFMLQERDVVTREYDFRVSENPDWRVMSDLRKQLYADHPVARSVIGTPESIRELTIEQAISFHQQFYHPANAVLIVSGDVAESQVTRLVNARFSKNGTTEWPAKSSHRQAWRQASISGKLDKLVAYPEKQAKAPRLAYASLSDWSTQGDDLQRYYVMQFVQRLLESALPGSIAKPLRLDHFILSGYNLGILELIDNQVELNIVAWPDEGVPLEHAVKRLKAALQQQGTAGVPQKSFERIKKRWLQTAQRESGDKQLLLWRSWTHLSAGLTPNAQADHVRRIESVSQTDVDSLLLVLGEPQRRIIGLITGE